MYPESMYQGMVEGLRQPPEPPNRIKEAIQGLLARFRPDQEPQLPPVRAVPPPMNVVDHDNAFGHMLQQPFTADTLSQLTKGTVDLNEIPHWDPDPEWQKKFFGVLGTTADTPDDNPNVIGVRRAAGPQRNLTVPLSRQESTFFHELVHRDDMGRQGQLPREVSDQVVAAYLEQKPDLLERWNKLLERDKLPAQSAQDFASQERLQVLNLLEANAYAWEEAMRALRTGRPLEEHRFQHPGADIAFKWLKENIK